MKQPLILFKDVTFKYHSQKEPTLHNINISIYEGEKVLIVGPSGSGKSTLAKCINGLIPHIHEGETSGIVKIKGKDVKDETLSSLSFDVGTVLQDTDGQFVGLTVGEDIAFALENDGVNQEQMHAEVKKWAEIVQLSDFLHHRPQDLSGGQKQRVSMAGAMIDDAPILLFDEPLANLDPKSGKETIAFIDRLHKETKTTVVIIEHRLEDVLYRAVDRIIVMNEGRILADTSPDTLLKTDLLMEQGIREPLYVSAMKYAGVDFSKVDALAHVEKISGEGLKEMMTLWQTKSIKKREAFVKEAQLTLKNVNYRYYKYGPLVLDDISVTFKKGEMISIVGNNGAGKSTLSKAICGFINPSEGEMMWKDQNFSRLSIKEKADKVGFVMQNPNQMISKKMIREEVAMGLVLRGVSEEEIRDRVDETLKICGLYPFRNWPISALSFGQKKRVTIASILVLKPEMIILDEPTAGQDFKHYTEMMRFLQSCNEQGMTVVMITHDMHLMLEYTERALVVHDGKIIADTDPVKVLTDKKLVDLASLKETSLFTFANTIGMQDPFLFTKHFITFEQEVKMS